MLKNTISGFAFAAALLMSGTALAADTPSLHQVYEAAQAGRLNEAQGMIQQVLKEHPDSAKAHFVDAEILAKTGHLSEAREEINVAERLDPGLPFAKPQAVQALKARVSASPAARPQDTRAPQSSAQESFPWGILLLMIGAIAVITLIMRAVNARNAAQTNYPAPYPSGSSGYPVGGQPVQGGGFAAPMMQGQAPGMGSGIMSSLATGAALGAGMVAGEALVHHFIDGNGNRTEYNPGISPANADTSSNDMGGSDFGIADNSSLNDNSNMADISGGDDWT